jgi:MFS family permease
MSADYCRSFADFGKLKGATLGLLGAILSLGTICGTPFISPVADRHSRQWGVFTGSLIMACGNLARVLATQSVLSLHNGNVSYLKYRFFVNPRWILKIMVKRKAADNSFLSFTVAMFLVARLVIGFRLVFANACSPVLAAELSHPTDRQVITSLYQTMWYLGAIMVAWTTFGTYRIPNNWS